MKKYKLSACGGTFDLFHKGHKDFLLSIFKVSEKIIIGITSDEFSSEKNIYENFSLRKKAVEKFVLKNNIHAEIIEINDVYGPTITNRYSFEALFVTEDSRSGAEKINEKRKDLGLNILKIVTVPLFKTLDGIVLSSSRIKNGEVDREGNLYIDESLLNQDFILPENLREKLSKPFGEIVGKIGTVLNENIVTVGDETTKTFVSKNIDPRLCIVDFKNNREKKYKEVSELGLSDRNVISVNNPSGAITKELLEAVKNGLGKNNCVVLVDGEEDLAVIPAVLASPLGFRIYYGQPGEGIVEILVTESKKDEIKKLLSQFTRKVI